MRTTSPTPRPTQHRSAVPVAFDVTPEPFRFALVSPSGVHDVRGRPDFAAASRWRRTLRRIDRVEFRLGARPAALVHGVGHRAPSSQPVALATAIALALRGTPVTLSFSPEREGGGAA